MPTKYAGEVVLFFRQDSFLSNHYNSQFTVKDITFNCVEQYFMYCKAKFFNDHVTAEAILSEAYPVKQKILGRQVINFNEDSWNSKCETFMLQGVRAKFTQNNYLKERLLSTDNAVIGEANRWDSKWGIGMDFDDPLAVNPTNWRGDNKLGKIHMQVRNELNNNLF